MSLQPRREDGWLLFRQPLPGVALPALELLAACAALEDRCKFALDGEGRRTCVLAELPDPAASPRRIDALVAGLAHAAAIAQGAGPARAGGAPQPEVRPDLAALVDETGWKAERRDDGFHVDLEVPGAYVGARLHADGEGIAVEAELLGDLASGVRGEAPAALLLLANRVFRGVRAVLRASGGARRALLEARLPADADASELRDALGALAVAARRCAREVQLLAADEALAGAYLAHQPPLRGDSNEGD